MSAITGVPTAGYFENYAIGPSTSGQQVVELQFFNGQLFAVETTDIPFQDVTEVSNTVVDGYNLVTLAPPQPDPFSPPTAAAPEPRLESAILLFLFAVWFLFRRRTHHG